MAYRSAFAELDKDLLQMCREGRLHVIEEDSEGNPLKMRAVASKFVLYWYHTKVLDAECRYWATIMRLPIFGIGQSFVPIRCMNCWKVVAKPRTLKELYLILDIQKEMDMYSKCGIEERLYTAGHYGAYWYSTTKEAGLECYKEVRDRVNIISPYIPVILKRGCTEYEFGMNGPSDKWKMFDGQVKFEEYIKSKIELMVANEGQSLFLKKMVMENWNAFAHSRGDLSYTEFNEGQLLYPQYVTYHKEVENE